MHCQERVQGTHYTGRGVREKRRRLCARAMLGERWFGKWKTRGRIKALDVGSRGYHAEGFFGTVQVMT